MLIHLTCAALAFVVVLLSVYVWRTFPILMSLHKGHVHNVKLTEGVIEQVDEMARRVQDLEATMGSKTKPASRRSTSKRKVTTA